MIKQVNAGTTPGLINGTRYAVFNAGDEICATLRQGNDDGIGPSLTCGGPNPAGTTAFAHDNTGNLTGATGGGDLAGYQAQYNRPGQTESPRVSWRLG